MKTCLLILMLAVPALGIKTPNSFYIQTSSAPAGIVGVAYSTSFTGKGGNTPYTWSLASGVLPAGLLLSTSSNQGILSGTPTTAKIYSFALQAKDHKGRIASQAYSVSITAAPPPVQTLSIITSSLPNGVVGTAYSSSLSATGGTPAYTWSTSAGSLPLGLALNSATGAITGTPTAANSYSFTAKVVDTSVPQQSYSRAYAVSITTAPLSSTLKINGTAITSQEVCPVAQVGSGTYTYPSSGDICVQPMTLTASGGTPPYSWSVVGVNPVGSCYQAFPGVWLANAATTCNYYIGPVTAGSLEGRATIAGTFSFTVQVKDSSVPQQVYQTAYAAFVAPTLVQSSSFSGGGIGNPWNLQLSVTGGVAPYVWSVSSGTLPACLSLNTSTGLVSGTCYSDFGTVNVSFRATDDMGNQFP